MVELYSKTQIDTSVSASQIGGVTRRLFYTSLAEMTPYGIAHISDGTRNTLDGDSSQNLDTVGRAKLSNLTYADIDEACLDLGVDPALVVDVLRHAKKLEEERLRWTKETVVDVLKNEHIGKRIRPEEYDGLEGVFTDYGSVGGTTVLVVDGKFFTMCEGDTLYVDHNSKEEDD